MKNSKLLNIKFNDINIKQYSKVTYLDSILDETLSGESMVIHAVNKINFRLTSLYQQNRLLNVNIQPFFG